MQPVELRLECVATVLLAEIQNGSSGRFLLFGLRHPQTGGFIFQSKHTKQDTGRVCVTARRKMQTIVRKRTFLGIVRKQALMQIG